jgi:hypothetical protein
MNQFQRIEFLFLELKHINERVSLLEKDNNKLRVENNDLSKDNVKLLKENIELREKIVVLNNRISKLDNPKTVEIVPLHLPKMKIAHLKPRVFESNLIEKLVDKKVMKETP